MANYQQYDDGPNYAYYGPITDSDPPPPPPPEPVEPPADVNPQSLDFVDTWTDGPLTKDNKAHKWLAGPDIHLTEVQTSSEASDKKPDPPPDVSQFTVNTGAMQARVHNLLNEEKLQVQKFNEFRSYVLGVKSWIFCVTDADQVGADGTPFPSDKRTGNTPFVDYIPTSPYDSRPGHAPSDDYVGLNQKERDDLNAFQDNLLQGVADVLNMVGQFTLSFDAVLQGYANADYHARFPAPPAKVPPKV